MPSRKKAANPRTVARGSVATPLDQIKAVVSVINAQAPIQPKNGLLGATPDATIQTCRRVLHSIAAFSRPGNLDLVMVDRAVLEGVDAALGHALNDVTALWYAAERMAKAVEVPNG